MKLSYTPIGRLDSTGWFTRNPKRCYQFYRRFGYSYWDLRQISVTLPAKSPHDGEKQIM